jgi:trk system potassium uptake protein TrkH
VTGRELAFRRGRRRSRPALRAGGGSDDPSNGAAARGLAALWQHLNAPQVLILSFLLLIAVGTLGFRLLPGLHTGQRLGWIDALFTVTSAVCVTGLSVVDVSAVLTGWGQGWLLLLIQAGGLGILTFAGVFLSLLGRRSALCVEEASEGPTDILPAAQARHLLRAVLGLTVTFEAAGALLLWLAWREEFGAVRSVWLAVFHSVSAFCNAGFSLFSEGMVRVRTDAAPLLVVAALVVAGGLGFPVIQDLRGRLRGRHPRLALHSRVVLVVTALLLALPTLLFWFFETSHTLAPLGVADRIVNAFFMAVTPRTAGFHTVDYDQVANPSLFLTIGLMWIGGAPFSVAGGVKVTTAALLVLVLWARMRGDAHVSVAGRTVPDETVNRAAGLAVGAFLLLAGFVFLLLAAESASDATGGDRAHFARLVFEVQSAFSTVGLSMNLTPRLSPEGRLLLVPVMLLGRLGPLAVLGAMAIRQRRRAPFRYAYENVLVG